MKVLVKYGLDSTAKLELLADSSVLPTGRPLFLPYWAKQFDATLAVAVRVSRLGKCVATRFAHRYWDAFTACLLTQATDTPPAGHDTLALRRAHDGALLAGQMMPRELLEAPQPTLQWHMGRTPVGQMALEQVPAIVDTTLSQVSQYMTLKMGDLLCLCSPVTHRLDIGQTCVVTLDDQALLKTNIK